MLFSSNVFIFFFVPVALIGYQLLGRFGRRAVFGWLSLVSLFFYGYWNPKYLFLLGGSILLNFVASRVIARVASERSKTIALVTAITANIALLFWFKYLFPLLHFFHSAGWLSRDYGSVILPLGISFFTFTQISYLVDLAQGQAERQDLLSYLLFVTFFPHLIAGPILHHKEMMPQFAENQFAESTSPTHLRRFSLNPDDVALGLTWFLMGLAKKVLIADKLAPTADLAFQHAGSLSATSAWTGLIVYSMQIYFDFSGYSDMALGLARIFSIRFPLNFDSPYKATSVTEYWQRWHMTLTRYITLYLYNPLLLAVQRRRLAAGRKISRKALTTVGGFTAGCLPNDADHAADRHLARGRAALRHLWSAARHLPDRESGVAPFPPARP
jgi:D-alanyl-lipoteichoic acid acyltransferase DltB (MBOAT superfamily)